MSLRKLDSRRRFVCTDLLDQLYPRTSLLGLAFGISFQVFDANFQKHLGQLRSEGVVEARIKNSSSPGLLRPAAVHLEAVLRSIMVDIRPRRHRRGRNPQVKSNGMAESFVKTFKRDYVHVNECPDAGAVMKMLATWFEDYNEFAPHKGLRMLSPREFIRLSATAECPV